MNQKVIISDKKNKRLRFYHSLKVLIEILHFKIYLIEIDLQKCKWYQIKSHKYIFEIKNKEET